MRIGIHTGKITGGIIGAKVVRYDIFGPDVLIANKMEAKGVAGGVCISASTFNLLKSNKFYFDTFTFSDHQDIEIGIIGKTIGSYCIERIYVDEVNSSVNGDSSQRSMTSKEHSESDQESNISDERSDSSLDTDQSKSD